jgi:hypothetical protein
VTEFWNIRYVPGTSSGPTGPVGDGESVDDGKLKDVPSAAVALHIDDNGIFKQVSRAKQSGLRTPGDDEIGTVYHITTHE